MDKIWQQEKAPIEQAQEVGETGIELVLFDLSGVLVEFRGETRMGELTGITDPDELWRRWLACPLAHAPEGGDAIRSPRRGLRAGRCLT